MDLKSGKNCHAIYNLQYHLIIVTKYRKKCINEKIFDIIKRQANKVFEGNDGSVEEINYESDHVHLLVTLPPQACISTVINSFKTTSARLVRKEYKEYLSKYYWKPVFWSRSYMILSSGGAPIEIIKQYIKEQGTEKHKNKKKRR